jgi:hypothetical protein
LLLQPTFALEHFGTKGKAATANEKGRNEFHRSSVLFLVIFEEKSQGWQVLHLQRVMNPRPRKSFPS